MTEGTRPAAVWTARAGASLSLLSGGALAAVPAASLSIAGQTLDTAGAGALSVALTVGLFLGQVISAWLVEARLATPGVPRAVELSRPLVVAAVAAGAVMALLPTTLPVLVVALPVLLVAMENGRAVGVIQGRHRREVVSASLLAAGALTGVLLALAGSAHGFSALAVGAVAAVAVRVGGERSAMPPIPAATRLWVTADVGLTGIAYPVLTSILLSTLGPAAAFLFSAVSTVSGLLAIPLNYLRARLLLAPSRGDLVLSSVVLAVAVAAIAAGEALRAFGLLFGPTWATTATGAALAVACAWRLASLASTVPFASLRRDGHVRLLLALRSSATAVTIAGATTVAVLTRDATLVFAVLLAGELLQATLYALARHRLRPRPAEELG